MKKKISLKAILHQLSWDAFPGCKTALRDCQGQSPTYFSLSPGVSDNFISANILIPSLRHLSFCARAGHSLLVVVGRAVCNSNKPGMLTMLRPLEMRRWVFTHVFCGGVC